MWHPLSSLPQIEIPDPETPSADNIADGIANFIQRYPIAVAAVILAIFIVRSWQKRGIAKGIIIGAALVIGLLFILSATT